MISAIYYFNEKEIVMGKPEKLNTKCRRCGLVVGREGSMYGHLAKKHKISGPGCIAKNCEPTSDPPTSPRRKMKKRKKKKDTKEQHKFSGFRGLDLYCKMPPNKGDKVIVVSVDIEINLTRGTNRIINK